MLEHTREPFEVFRGLRARWRDLQGHQEALRHTRGDLRAFQEVPDFTGRPWEPLGQFWRPLVLSRVHWGSWMF